MEQVHPVHRHSQEQEEHDAGPAQAGGKGDTGQAGQYGGRIHREQRAGDRGKAGHQLRVAEGAETRHRHDSYARVRADRAVLKLQVPGAARRRRCRPPSHQELPRRGSLPARGHRGRGRRGGSFGGLRCAVGSLVPRPHGQGADGGDVPVGELHTRHGGPHYGLHDERPGARHHRQPRLPHGPARRIPVQGRGEVGDHRCRRR